MINIRLWNIIFVIINAENNNLGLGQFTDQVTLSPTFRPGFFKILERFIGLLIGRERDHFQKS